jgi:hypothetical protein
MASLLNLDKLDFKQHKTILRSQRTSKPSFKMVVQLADLNKLHGSKLTVCHYRKGFNWMMKLKGYKGFCEDMQNSNEMPVGRPTMEHAFHWECNRLAVKEGAWQPDQPGHTSLKARTIELMFSVACDMVYYSKAV